MPSPLDHTPPDDSLVVIRTPRLLLRRWRDEDREPFAAINASPRVMQYFPKTFTRDESDAAVDRITAHLEKHPYGLWAVEIPGVAPFIGFVGLTTPRFEASFTPCVEIGWRIAEAFWNRGYATEGARAALEYGFQQAGLQEILSFAVPHNIPSRRVMEKIGMHHNPADDFDHPLIAAGHPLRRHVLYRIMRTT